MNFYDELIEAIVSGRISGRDEIQRKKMELCRKYPMDSIPGNAEVLAYALENVDPCHFEVLERVLQIKPVRTISGVAIVAVMTSPHDCPHGKCKYCPGGVDNGTAQSYTGREPAALRAAHNDFDPYRQVAGRIGQLRAIGHKTDKVDLIIMGGTFTAREPEYQTEFVKRCFDAMNSVGLDAMNNVGFDAVNDVGAADVSRAADVIGFAGVSGRDSPDIRTAQQINETAAARCIGMTVETRPDYFTAGQIDRSLEFGATRVELGVQTLNDKTLEAMERGHGSAETALATQLARDAGMKIGYHMMPGLPGETPESDLATFEKLFADPAFRPDVMKIYPTLVIEGTDLHKMWLAGDFEPYDMDTLTKLLADIKAGLPPYTRIQRIMRDIPVQLIEAGAQKSHIRQLARNELAARGKKCRCIRCREAGHLQLKEGLAPEDVQLIIEEYEASKGTEFFISYEDVENDILVAFVRLRIPGPLAHRPEVKNGAMIRELRVLGQQVPIGGIAAADGFQHRGYGELLIEKCKEIANSQQCVKLLVMSGVGVREYYRKLGFERDGPYMSIPINNH